MSQRVVVFAMFIALLCASGFAQTASETAKRVASDVTGFDALDSVQITVTEVTVSASADTTPIVLFKNEIVNTPLWKVSYVVNTMQYQNKSNSHIRGFDVYVNVGTEQVLKVVSRNAPNMTSTYRTGIEVSNRQLASILSEDSRFIKDALPTGVPAVKFADCIIKKAMSARHYEGYYILYHNPATNVSVPAWLIVFYGTEPIHGLGPVPEGQQRRYYTLTEKYQRTFEAWVYDATSGRRGWGAQIVGTNDDTFD